MNTITEEYRRILRWAEKNFPALANVQGAPATPEAISAAEVAIELQFSEQLRELYACADGELRDTPGLFFGLRFLSLADLIQNIQTWYSICTDDPEMAESTDFQTSTPEGAIDTRYFQKGWIPFVEDYGGNYIAIDMAPGPMGTVGQVITMGRNEDDKRVIATDLATFMEWIAVEIENGNFEIRTHSYNPEQPYEFVLAEPANDHFFDALKELSAPLTLREA